MKNYILLLLIIISSKVLVAQKDTLKSKTSFTIGAQFNNIRGRIISNSLSKQYIERVSFDKGFVGGVRLGVNWKHWNITYRSSFAFVVLSHSLIFKNTQKEYDFYSIEDQQKSLINTLEISRVLQIPESKYYFEIGFGVGFSYLKPDKRVHEKSFFYEDYPNEYNISNSVVYNNPNHRNKWFDDVFLRFYRQLGKHSIGVNVDLIEIENTFRIDLYTDNKFAFSKYVNTKNYSKPFSQFSFGINYKILLGK